MPRDKDKAPKDQPRKPRRTGAAAAVEHLIQGGKYMTDDQLEIAAAQLMQRR